MRSPTTKGDGRGNSIYSFCCVSASPPEMSTTFTPKGAAKSWPGYLSSSQSANACKTAWHLAGDAWPGASLPTSKEDGELGHGLPSSIRATLMKS